jgi:hypothetical protein
MKEIEIPTYDDWTRHLRCDRCGTEAVAEASDLLTRLKTTGYIFADTLRTDRVFYVECPYAPCAAQIFIDAERIPAALRLLLVNPESMQIRAD